MKIKKQTLMSKWFKYEGAEGVEIELTEIPMTNYLLSLQDSLHNVFDSEEERESKTEKAILPAITNWTGLFGEDDRPLKLTKENKKLVFKANVDLMVFIQNSFFALQKEAQDAREEAEKNL